ncbi:MAG: AAA family ATPase [Clostridia bacterium]|nr:AAA family ATPase [Clostridia bacterium]
MKLKSISIGNFKNVADTTLDLSRMIALVSTNNYGKSNLLEAIRFGFDFIAGSARQRTNMMHWTRGIPLSPSLAEKDYFFSIEFDEPQLEQYRYVKYSFSFSWFNDNNTGAVITDESIEVRASESVRYTAYLKRDLGEYRAKKDTKAFRKISLAKDVLAIDVLSSVDDIEIGDVISSIKSLSYRICKTLELDKPFLPVPIEFDFGTSSELSFVDSDLPKALSMLIKEKPKQYNLFVETILDLFPEFERIELQYYTLNSEDIVETQSIMLSSKDDAPSANDNIKIPYRIKDELYRLVIHSKYLNQPISMEHMSTGTKRIFWLIANAVLGSCYGINLIGVDEIETSIHPKMISKLLESLNHISEDTSMILTSHSPYLIQYLKPEALYVGAPKDDGVAYFRRIQKTKTKSLLKTTRSLETTVGEYLFELMAGDEDSASILSAYLGD